MKRHKLSAQKSRRIFQRTAGNNSVHPKNTMGGAPMRGGIRL